MSEETLEAKLRNQLSPIYGLADLVLLIDERPQLKSIIMNSAKQVIANREKIDDLLFKIETKKQNLKFNSDEAIKKLAQVLLEYHDTGESSVNHEARVVWNWICENL